VMLERDANHADGHRPNPIWSRRPDRPEISAP
jgi:hypothetical protein